MQNKITFGILSIVLGVMAGISAFDGNLDIAVMNAILQALLLGLAIISDYNDKRREDER